MTTSEPIWRNVMVTGHRSLSDVQTAFARAELVRIANKVREHHGAEVGISGMALGADTWWAEAVLDAGLALDAYIPFTCQSDRWPPDAKSRWRDLLGRSRQVINVGADTYDVRLLHARNAAMVDAADACVAVYDPSHTTGGTVSAMRKVRATGLPLVVVNVAQMTVTIERGARIGASS